LRALGLSLFFPSIIQESQMLPKHLQQAEVEATYSRKNIRGLVKADVNPDHPVFVSITQLIYDYRIGAHGYYQSKR